MSENKLIKILFVCHGNICRSPMAEFVMKDIVDKSGLSANFKIESAAVSNEELGSPVYPPVKRILNANGIDCSAKRARKLTKADYQNYDILVGMDSDNIRRMINICEGDSLGKICLLKKFSGNPNGEVADPWYTGGFDETWQDVQAGCKGILDFYTKKLS